jgi:hypothetical protein
MPQVGDLRLSVERVIAPLTTPMSKSGLRHLRHQPERSVRNRETWSQRCRDFRVGDLHAGNDDPAVRKAAVASGCISFLTKLFSMVALIKPPKKASAAYSWAAR